MQKDNRNLVEVLRFELEVLERQGYTRARQAPWRPHFVFEDSPACRNYALTENVLPCSHCVLMELVPPERRLAKKPCRHIPLNAAEETLDSLYRYCHQEEVQETVARWLRSIIRRLKLGTRTP